MKTKTANRKKLFISILFLTAFAAWTLLIKTIDLKNVGPQDSTVGLATLNTAFHKLTGANMWIYYLTDYLSIIPICVAFCFASLGLFQLIKRKSLTNVDRNIIILGIFYISVISAFLLFEVFPVNYRPILIDGRLEASYPSSTTLLVGCIMPTAMMQLNDRISNKSIRTAINIAIISFTVFMIIGRLISGVHWLTDIIGGALLCTGLVMGYWTAVDKEN